MTSNQLQSLNMFSASPRSRHRKALFAVLFLTYLLSPITPPDFLHAIAPAASCIDYPATNSDEFVLTQPAGERAASKPSADSPVIRPPLILPIALQMPRLANGDPSNHRFLNEISRRNGVGTPLLC